jgi:hypothetical protein
MKTHNGFITELSENEVFVFGSNLSGIHGKGAAKTAVRGRDCMEKHTHSLQ